MKSVSSAHFADEETEAHTQDHTTIRAELGFDLLSSESTPLTFALRLLGTLSRPHHDGQSKTCSIHLSLIPTTPLSKAFPDAHSHGL